ncbi:MAG: hypothetical protein WCW34_02815 [Patescibacteria group bacterium]
MSPRCMLSVLLSHVRRGRVIPLVAFLITLLVSFKALADDNPYKSSEACFTTVKTEVVEGKTYSLVTFDKDLLHDHPRACDLRTAYNRFPIRDSAGKLLSVNEWERSIFAANQGSHPTVLRGCVPDKQAPAYATDEEKASCPRGKYHYYPVPSNGWKVYIRMPQEQRVTWAEIQATAAKVACAGAQSPEAKKACQDAGYATVSDQATAANDKAAKLAKEFESKLAELQKKLADAEKTLGETKEQLARTKRDNFWLAFYGSLISVAFIFEVIRNWRLKKRLEVVEKNLKTARENLEKALKSQGTVPPNVARMQTQLAEVDKKNKELVAEHEAAKTQWQAALAEANRQKDEAVTQRDKANEDPQKANGEITGLRDELRRKNQEVQFHERRWAQFEGQVAGFQRRVLDLEEQLAVANDNASAARNRELESQVAERDSVITSLRGENARLAEQLRVANDNAQAGNAPPSTETAPPSTETSPQTAPDEQAEKQFVFVRPWSDPDSLLLTLVEKLGGDAKVVLASGDPDAIMFQLVILAEVQKGKLDELSVELESANSAKSRAEDRVIARETKIGERDQELVSTNDKLLAQALELSGVRKDSIRLRLLYWIARIALMKAIDSDRDSGSTPSESKALARYVGQSLGCPKLPQDIIPPGNVDDDDPGEISVEGGSRTWDVEQPTLPRTRTIPIASDLSRKDKAGQG